MALGKDPCSFPVMTSCGYRGIANCFDNCPADILFFVSLMSMEREIVFPECPTDGYGKKTYADIFSISMAAY